MDEIFKMERSLDELYLCSCPIELEHIEICFKPKEKFMGAFRTLQSLMPIIQRTRIKRLNYDWCNESVAMGSEDFFNAINLRTGELNLEMLLVNLGSTISKKDIKKSIADEDLKEKLLLARKKLKYSDDYKCEDAKVNEYLSHNSVSTLERNLLMDYILNENEESHLVLNIMELVEDGEMEGIGKLIGTLAEEVTDVIYIDSRDVVDEPVVMYKSIRKYKQLDFNFSTKEKELVIWDIDVPKKDVYINYLMGDRCFENEKVHQNAVIKLSDMDSHYHVEAEINIEKAYQPHIAKALNLMNMTIKGYETGILKFDNFGGISSKDGLYKTRVLFDILNYNYDICKQLIDDLPFFFYTRMSSRNYELVKAYEEVAEEDEELYNMLTANYEELCRHGRKSVEDYGFNFSEDDLLNSIENIVINQVDDEGKQWKFEGDFSYITEKELRKYFNAILQNLGENDNPGFIEITKK